MPPICEGGPCQLFSVFGIFVQASIGLWCLVVLVIMWRCEENPRSCMTWFGDMAKQLAGAGWTHLMNVFCSIFFGAAMVTLTNQCVWYLVVFLTDITLATFLCWAVTAALRPPLVRHCGIDIGDYDAHNSTVEPLGDEDEKGKEDETSSRASSFSLKQGGTAAAFMGKWLLQTSLWIVIVTLVKLAVFGFVYLTQDVLYDMIAWCFHAAGLCGHVEWQLIVSVIIVPVVGDAFQFAMQDIFLKRRDASKKRGKSVSPLRDGDSSSSVDLSGSDSG